VLIFSKFQEHPSPTRGIVPQIENASRNGTELAGSNNNLSFQPPTDTNDRTEDDKKMDVDTPDPKVEDFLEFYRNQMDKQWREIHTHLQGYDHQNAMWFDDARRMYSLMSTILSEINSFEITPHQLQFEMVATQLMGPIAPEASELDRKYRSAVIGFQTHCKDFSFSLLWFQNAEKICSNVISRKKLCASFREEKKEIPYDL